MNDNNIEADNVQLNNSLEGGEGFLKYNKNLRNKDAIPFISKIAKDEKEEFRNMHANKKIKKNSGNKRGEDEIDSLLNSIDRSKGKIIIDDMAKLDFDETEGQKKIKTAGKNMDIRESFLGTNVNINNKISSENKKNDLNININVNNNSNMLPLIKSNKKSIIDPYIVNNKKIITNSDLILCILELCINSKEYGFKYKTKSRAFWEEIIKKNNLKQIFINFKPDTLKKYWSYLAELKEYNKIVELINEYKDIIDSDDEIKLLPLISHISDFIKSKKDNFEDVLFRLLKRDKTRVNTFLGEKRNYEEAFHQFEEIDLEKNYKKVKTDRPTEDDPLLLDEATMEMLLEDGEKENNSSKGENVTIQPIPTPMSVSNNQNFNIKSNNFTFQNNNQTHLFLKEAPIPKNRVIFPVEKEKNNFNDIDLIIQTIVNSLSLNSNEFNSDIILEILKKTSFNIEHTYLYLTDKEQFKFLLFTDMEDYIIKNMRKSDYYNEVLKTKGFTLLEEREKFLNIG